MTVLGRTTVVIKEKKTSVHGGKHSNSDIRTARFKQLSLSCRQPNQGNRMIHVVVRGRVITLIQPVSHFRSPQVRVGRSWAVGREAVAWVPGGGLPAVAQPVPPLLLGRLPDGEPLLLLLVGGGVLRPGRVPPEGHGETVPWGVDPACLSHVLLCLCPDLWPGFLCLCPCLCPSRVGVVYKDTLWAPVSTAKWSNEVEKGVGDLESGETCLRFILKCGPLPCRKIPITAPALGILRVRGIWVGRLRAIRQCPRLRLLVQGRAVSPYPVQDSGRQLLNAERDMQHRRSQCRCGRSVVRPGLQTDLVVAVSAKIQTVAPILQNCTG